MHDFPFQNSVLGTWPLTGPFLNHGRQMGWGPVSESDAIRAIRFAYANGIRWFDTADAYGDGTSSRLLATALADCPRTSYAISLKVGYNERYGCEGNAPDNIVEAIERSLGDLSSDYVDLFSFHHLDFGPDAMFLDGAMEVVSELHSSGVLKRIGYRFAHVNTVSGKGKKNETERILRQLQKTARDSLHAKLNLLSTRQHRDAVVKASQGRQLFINKPFAQGLLWRLFESRDWTVGETDHRAFRSEFELNERIELINHMQRELDHIGLLEADLPALSLAVLLQLDASVSIIFGAKSYKQVQAFLDLPERARAISDAVPNIQNLTLWR